MGHEGGHPVHDTVSKSCRHMIFFQHVRVLQVRTPRVRLPNGSVRLVESAHRVMAVCERCVHIALGLAAGTGRPGVLGDAAAMAEDRSTIDPVGRRRQLAAAGRGAGAVIRCPQLRATTMKPDRLLPPALLAVALAATGAASSSSTSSVTMRAT